MSDGCKRCGSRTCDGCKLCCCAHPGHRLHWEPPGHSGCRETFDRAAEEGLRLASERDDLIAAGVDPDELLVPIHPEDV